MLPPLPIPGAALSQPLTDKLTLGLGVFAPNALVLDYPEGVDAEGNACSPGASGCEAAPQRYSLLSMRGTALAHIAAAVAWQPIEGFAIGFGAHVMMGMFEARTAISACDGAICTQNENPEWDANARLNLLPVFDVGPTAGVTYDAGPIRFGTSFIWWPRAIRGTADMDVRLPSAPLFEGATVDGDQADVRIDFPFQLRFGVEVRPVDRLRIETAAVWERWSTQRAIAIEPQDVWIRDLVAIGDYQVGAIHIPRNMNDVWSLRLGGSLALLEDRSLVLSAGVNYENSAFDPEYLTPLTIDSRKIILGAGISYQLFGQLWLDASYAHVFMDDVTVTNSAVPQPTAIQPPQSEETAAYIGNGQYRMAAHILGVGLRVEFAPPRGPGHPKPATMPPNPEDPPRTSSSPPAGADEESDLDLEG